MSKFILLILVVLSVTAQSFKDRVESYVRDIYGEVNSSIYKNIYLTKYDIESIELRAKQRFFQQSLHCWKILLVDSTKRYIVLDNVIGKVQPITFIIVFTENFEIELVDILKYRESYGHEVKMKSFLMQFQNLNQDSDFLSPTIIRNISGATISVNSMRRGVKKLSFLIHHIQKEFNEF